MTTKTCPITGESFEIYDEDVAFLKKLGSVNSYDIEIPLPTLSPSARLMRKMAFRNQRNLYRRKCDVTGKEVVSIYSPDNPHKICEKNHWYSDRFDPLEYGKDYDSSRPFFDQFHELLLEIPLPSLRVESSENCEFNNEMRRCNNCYLSTRTHESSDMLYCYRGNKSSSCTDCMQVVESEFLYECIDCMTCYDSVFLHYCERCSNSGFLINCRNCDFCFLCTNLDRKKYCFLNEQLTEEEYKAKMKEFSLGSWETYQMAIEAFEKLKKRKSPGSSLDRWFRELHGEEYF